MQKQGANYYTALWRAIETEAAALKQYLLSIDLTDFDPSAPPPQTQAKAAIIEASRPPLEALLDELIEAEEWPFGRDLVRLDDAATALRAKYGEPVRSGAMQKAAKACGMRNLATQVVLAGGGKPRLWSVRNHDRWGASTAEEVRTEMSRPTQPIL